MEKRKTETMEELVKKIVRRIEKEDNRVSRLIDFFLQDCTISFLVKTSEKGDRVGLPKYTVCVIQNKRVLTFMEIGIASLSYKDEWDGERGSAVALAKAIRSACLRKSI